MAHHARGGQKPRILFSSYHCYLDPSSGAAVSGRDLLEMLTGRGWQCRVFCGPHQDSEEGQSFTQLLTDSQHRFDARSFIEVDPCTSGPMPFSLYDFVQGGIPVTIYSPPVTHPGQPLTREEGYPFLALFEQQLEWFRPDLVLTYGGRHLLTRELIALAKRRDIPVVFWLRNCEYGEADLFEHVDGAIVPSRCTQAYYQRTLGLACTALPCPLNRSRFLCPEVQGRYVLFVNPQPHKGVFLVARIAHELGRQRPDIPLLIQGGRGEAGWLGRTGLDLGELPNLHFMSRTPDPRVFYRLSRLVLMPSFVEETFGLVAAEALINGIPVLASRRGALPETLAEAGFLFDIPECYTPHSRVVPTAEEAAPWVETIIRLWDDAEFYAEQRHRCLAAAEAWQPERLAARYEEFFAGILH